jgi:hypothetical protein
MAEFEAIDAAVALFRAEPLVRGGGSVFIFEDGRTLGKVELDSSGFWTIASSEAGGSRCSN